MVVRLVLRNGQHEALEQTGVREGVLKPAWHEEWSPRTLLDCEAVRVTSARTAGECGRQTRGRYRDPQEAVRGVSVAAHPRREVAGLGIACADAVDGLSPLSGRDDYGSRARAIRTAGIDNAVGVERAG